MPIAVSWCSINKSSAGIQVEGPGFPLEYNIVTRMAHGSLREFDLIKESVEDFHECLVWRMAYYTEEYFPITYLPTG